MKRLGLFVATLAALAVTVGVSQPAEAQGLAIGGSNSNFGSARLSAGFTPDPHTVQITSGGTLNVSGMGLGSGCVGHATRQPDFILHLSGQSSMLRFFNVAAGDTALVINDGSGTWHCNDDSHGGQNPTVSIRNAPAGQYDIWVTSYNSGENLRGTLHITELQNRHPGNSGGSGSSGSGGLSIGGNSSNFGSANIAAGFTPDPRTVTITSGGTLHVNGMGLGAGCVGYATRQPDYIVNLSGQSSMLRFYNVAGGDTALVINDGGGNWHCNDDSHGGQNPTVSIQNAPAGQYDVWVTSYNSGDNIRGTLHITELNNRHP